MSFCKSCNAPIDWYRNERTGKWMPLDKEPAADGNVFVDVVANVARVVDPGSHTPLYKSHFVTCAQAAQHRRRA